MVSVCLHTHDILRLAAKDEHQLSYCRPAQKCKENVYMILIFLLM